MVKPRRPVMRGLPGAILAAAMLALAGCGGVVTGPGGGQLASPARGGGQGTGLCANASYVDRLVVSLVAGAARPGHPLPVPPDVGTIRQAAKVRAVAAALCSLPAMPPGPLSCPADLGGSYRLTFSAGDQVFPPVTARITGCRAVSGVGRARRATAAFWALVHKELGMGVRARPTTVPAVP